MRVFLILAVRTEGRSHAKRALLISSELSEVRLDPVINENYFLKNIYHPKFYSFTNLVGIQLTSGWQTFVLYIENGL